MVDAIFTETGVFFLFYGLDTVVLVGSFSDLFDTDLFRILEAQRQLIAVDLHFHRIAQRRKFDQRQFRTGNDAHIQKMLTECAFSADARDSGVFIDFEIF